MGPISCTRAHVWPRSTRLHLLYIYYIRGHAISCTRMQQRPRLGISQQRRRCIIIPSGQTVNSCTRGHHVGTWATLSGSAGTLSAGGHVIAWGAVSIWGTFGTSARYQLHGCSSAHAWGSVSSAGAASSSPAGQTWGTWAVFHAWGCGSLQRWTNQRGKGGQNAPPWALSPAKQPQTHMRRRQCGGGLRRVTEDSLLFWAVANEYKVSENQ